MEHIDTYFTCCAFTCITHFPIKIYNQINRTFSKIFFTLNVINIVKKYDEMTLIIFDLIIDPNGNFLEQNNYH